MSWCTKDIYMINPQSKRVNILCASICYREKGLISWYIKETVGRTATQHGRPERAGRPQNTKRFHLPLFQLFFTLVVGLDCQVLIDFVLILQYFTLGIAKKSNGTLYTCLQSLSAFIFPLRKRDTLYT